MTPRLTGLEIGDAPEAWRRAGFAVEHDHVDLGPVRVRLAGADDERGILGWQLDGAPQVPVEGLRPAAIEASGPSGTRHPNGVTIVDHVVVGTTDVERTTDALAALGLQPRRTAPEPRGAPLVQRFFLLGTCVLELVGPREVDPARTPRGARFVGLALVAPDLDVAHRLGVAGESKAAIQPGRRICTVRTEDLDVSVPLAILTPRG